MVCLSTTYCGDLHILGGIPMTEEKKQVMSIGVLLAGTPLLTFLMELATMPDGELIDETTKAVCEGETVLGTMNGFEQRLSVWYDRRKKQLNAEMKDLYGKMELLDEQSQVSTFEAMQKLSAFDQETEERILLLGESIRSRFPDAKDIGLRAGFTIVANAKRRESYGCFSIIAGSGVGDLAAALMGLGCRGHRG